ncbi:MAG TPA: hypothetical protein VL588_05995 [Bdellovibrionota bacterium]|nr:hypothetical protein [Bdellovibrionota bacterium]
MKKSISVAALFALTVSFALPAHAQSPEPLDLNIFVQLAQSQTRDLINWKVGDSMNYNVSLGFMGNGTMVKNVASEEGGNIWLHQDINIMNQKQTVDVLMQRSDGKILKVLQNGQEAQIPDSKIEVVSTNFDHITVPAGTFDCMHIVANTDQAKGLEVWGNPDMTAMDGSLKEIVPTQFGMTMTLELTAFHKVQ